MDNKNKRKLANIDDRFKEFKNLLLKQSRNRQDLYNNYTQYDLTSNIEDPYYTHFSDYSELQENQTSDDNDNEGFFGSIWSGVKSVGLWIGEQAVDLWYAHNVGMKKLADQAIDIDASKIMDLENSQKDLDLIEEYDSLRKQYESLKRQRNLASVYQRPQAEINQLDDEITETRQRINELDDYFLGEGRTHSTIAYHMFDYDNESLMDKLFVNSKYITKDVDTNTGFNPLKVIGAGLEFVGGVIDWGLTTGSQGIESLWGGDSYDGYKTADVIRYGIDDNNLDHLKFLYRRYKGLKDDEFLERRGMNNDLVKSWMKDYQFSIDKKRLNELREYNDRELVERNIELQNDISSSKDGKFSIALMLGVTPFIGDWLRDNLQDTWAGDTKIKLFDYDAVPQLFIDELKNVGENWYDMLTHPIYTSIEVASTIGLYKHQLGALGVDGAVRYVSKKLPVWAGGPEGVAAKMLAGADVMAGFNAAVQSRKDETALEAIQGYSERVLLDYKNAATPLLDNNTLLFDNINNQNRINTLLTVLTEGLQKRNINTNGLTDDQIMKLGLAYNINTGDEDFDNIKDNALKGLNKLINANNALAVVDYLQALPFMSYAGDALKTFSKSALRRTTSVGERLYLAEKYKKGLTGALDNAIDRVAKKYIAKDLGKALALKHGALYVVKNGKLLLVEGLSEGLEEINQEILQSRYKRGLYDDYDKGRSMFVTSELFENIDLASEALPDYFGIHPWDPELSTQDIQKAFNIGFASSIFFSKAMHAMTNLRDVENDQNMRQLLYQIKNDKQVQRLAAEYAGQIQDLQHLNIFYDAFNQANVNRSRMQKSLSDLRDMVREDETLVKKEFVDNDIRMMNAVWAMYNNNFINDHLAENGIERFSDQYKQLVIQGAKAIVDALKTEELVRDQIKSIGDIQNNHIQLVEDMFRSQGDPETLSRLEQESPELANIVKTFSKEYDSYIASRNASRQGHLSGFSRRLQNFKDFQNNSGIQQYILNKIDEAGNDENGNPISSYEDMEQHVFYNKEERKNAIRYAFSLENYENWSDRLKTWDEFRRNKYIRQVIRDGIVGGNGLVRENDFESALRKAYDDETAREEVINKAFDKYDNGDYTRESYITERVRGLHQYYRMKRMEKALNEAQDQANLLRQFRKITGLDVDPTRLQGIANQLKKSLDEAKKNEEILLNGTAEHRDPNKPLLTLEDFFGGKDLLFDDQQQFDEVFGNFILNKAILGPQRTVANMFMNGSANPISLREAIFGENAENILEGEESEFRLKMSEESQEDELDQDVTKKAAIQQDKRKISQKAAWKVIKKYIDEAEERHRIANRVYEDEIGISSEESTPNVIEEQQVESAEQVQEKQTGENKTVDKKTTEEDPNEKRLQEKYNHRSGKKESLEDRVQRRRKMSQGEVLSGENVNFDDSEEPSLDVADIDENDEDVELNPQDDSEESVKSTEEQTNKKDNPSISSNAQKVLSDIKKDGFIESVEKNGYNSTGSESISVDDYIKALLELSAIPEYYNQYKNEIKRLLNAIKNDQQFIDQHKDKPSNTDESEADDPTVIEEQEDGSTRNTGGAVMIPNAVGQLVAVPTIYIQELKDLLDAEKLSDIKNLAAIIFNSRNEDWRFGGQSPMQVAQALKSLNEAKYNQKIRVFIEGLVEAAKRNAHNEQDPEYLLEGYWDAPKNDNYSSNELSTENNNDSRVIEQVLKSNEEDLESADDVEEEEPIDVTEDMVSDENIDVVEDIVESAAEEEEELNQAAEDISKDGWIEINDYEGFEYNEAGALTYDGEVLPEDQAKFVEDELSLMSLIEAESISQEELPNGKTVERTDKRVLVVNDTVGDYISQTFFYRPDAEIDEITGDILTVSLKVNGKELQFNKPVAPGSKLAKKLAQTGWLDTTTQYYVVRQSLQSKNVVPGSDPRDSFTVALVIEDDENCYITTLRALGLTESDGKDLTVKAVVNSETNLRNSLRIKNVNWSKLLQGNETLPKQTSKKVKLFEERTANIAVDLAKAWYYSQHGTEEGFQKWWTTDPKRESFAKNEENKWKAAVSEHRRQRNIFLERARLSVAIPGKRLLTEELISEQIDKLREHRNSIIEQYCTKITKNGKTEYVVPETVRTDIVPTEVVQSNGKINNQKENFNPVYRTISSSDESIEDIQKQLENGDIVLGLGLGMFASEGDEFKIRGLLDNDATTEYNGKGLSGKIYWMVNGPAKGSKKVPIMLAEELFDTQVRVVNGKQETVYLNNPDNLQLCLAIDPNTRELINVNTKGYLPSAAEILFYMLTDKFDIGLGDIELRREIVEFFIHNDIKTLLKHQPKSGNDPFGVLAEKQLAWYIPEGQDEYILTIGINENGVTRAKDFTQNDLFGNTKEAEINRRTVIQAIATQMHWNTDVAHMNSTITLGSQSGSGMSFFLQYMILKYANKDFDNIDDYLNQEVSILGCPQLSFRIGDFYQKKLNADEWETDAIEPKENVSVLAWMIKTGRIKTDAGKNVFKDPFVFATGVKNASGNSGEQFNKTAEKNGDDPSSQSVVVTKPKPKTNRTIASEEFSLFDKAKYDEMTSSWREGLEQKRKRSGWFVASNEDERQQVIDSINNTKGAKDNGGIIDRIMFRAPTKTINPNNIEKYIRDLIQNFLDKYNKQYPENAVLIEDINIPAITIELAKTVYGSKKGFMILDLYKNGKGKVVIKKDLDLSAWNNPVTGIFSRIKSKKKFNDSETRKWLSEKLGIDQSNVVILDAAMRSFTNELVFGLTNVALDRIAGEITGYIMLSREGGQGVTYHEAWHYVNLLMHDRNTRDRIYKSYLNAHKKMNKEGITFLDVEEAIAEDFRRYMEGITSSGITGAIRRLYNNILDFVITTTGRSAYRRAFIAIKNGAYSGAKLDLQSVAEFRARYNKGVNMVNHEVSGISNETLAKMPNINSYQQFFDTTLSVIDRIFAEMNIKSVKKIRELSGSNFNVILSMLDLMIDEQIDEDAAARLQDIRDNQEVLKRQLIETFVDLGIRAKVKTVEDVRQTTNQDEISEDVLRKEEEPINNWDKFDLSISKKDNAAFNVKLFLRCIPKARIEYYDDGTSEIVYDRDEYGTIRLEDFSESWNKVIETLWEATSLDERDEQGNYTPDSMMGILNRERKSDPFFEIVYQRLEELNDNGEYGDIQLRSQFWATINSNKQKVQYIQLKNPETFDDGDLAMAMAMSDLDFEEDNGVVADRLREWDMKDDSLISAARNIPRRWSKRLASQGLIDFNEKTNKTVISKNFVQRILSTLDLIKKTIKSSIPVDKKGVVNKTERELRDILYGTVISARLNKLPDNTDGFESGDVINVGENYYRLVDKKWKSTKKYVSLKDQIVDFLTSIGIQSDIQSLNIYISMFLLNVSDTTTPSLEIKALDKIFNSSGAGSISFVVNSLVNSIGKEEITKEALGGRSKYGKGIDEAFNDFAADSYIGKLALAWNASHPSSLELAVRGPNGEMLYPIGQNNYLSDRIRTANALGSAYAAMMQKSHYCRHSLIADAAKQVKKSDPKTKLVLAPFVGLKDVNVSRGADYFGINAMEDYLAKLFMTDDEQYGDQIILPTMADKKTWYSISSSNIKLSHDAMLCLPLNKDINKHIYEEYEKINPYDQQKDKISRGIWEYKAAQWYYSLSFDDPVRKSIFNSATNDLLGKSTPDIGFNIDEYGNFIPTYQKATLDRFSGYFLDELDSLLAYYSKDHIAKIVKNPNLRIQNFHGKVKKGRLDFSGNGGKFRYFYDIVLPEFDFGHNLNLHIEALFELLKKIEEGGVKDLSKREGDIRPYVGTSILSEDPNNLDGFELVREFLIDMRKKLVSKDGSYNIKLLQAINKKLIDQTYKELDRISTPGSPIQLAKYDAKKNIYIPTAIPELLLNRYVKVFQKAKYGPYGEAYDTKALQHHALFSLIANHVANTATSIIEVEKMFTGDPAFYKKKTNKKNPKSTVVIDYSKNGQVVQQEVKVENLDDVYSDKIKRLGGTESPGEEIRLTYSKRELEFDPSLNSTKYTNLNIEDLEIPSAYLKLEIEPMFKTQLLIDYIRSEDPLEFYEFISELQKTRDEKNKKLLEKGAKTKQKITYEDAIDIIYSNSKYFEKMFNKLSKEVRSNIENSLEQQLAPYKNITVSDAQVFIRPALYRKIRIGLGQWTFEPDENGYCDENAYNIIEGDDTSWMKDPKKYNMVRKLLLFPLKMSYFQNDPHSITEKVTVNDPIYNKMAIFPLFKFQTSTEIGKALYERMNRLSNELDMISFKSAVKVGAVQKTIDPTTETKDAVINRIRAKKGKDKDYEPTFDEIYEEMDVKNAIASLGNSLNPNSSSNINYETGDVISNTEDNTLPVTIQDLSNLRMQLNTQAHESEIRAIGTQMFKIAFSNIIDDAIYGTGKSGRPGRKGSEIKADIINCINKLTSIGVLKLRDRFFVNGHLNDAEVTSFIKSVVENNGLGSSAQDIIQNGGIAAGLVSRTVFEQSASSVVNADVVNINTKGGTAILQSVFGFVGYLNKSVVAATKVDENGKEIKNDNYEEYLSYNGGKELKWSAKEGSMQVLLSMNFFKSVVPKQYQTDYTTMRNWLLEHNIIGENAKAFGVGYRIPTQGMSSMFSMQVADVLPEQVGDLIVVPREFTAQTGSDFDVDKLFLATMSYRDGVFELASEKEISQGHYDEDHAWDIAEDRLLVLGETTETINSQKWSEDTGRIVEEDLAGAILNRLLMNYIDIISDRRNYANARGSIDVITNKLHDELLDPILKIKRNGYVEGMTELLPSFLALRKMEFGVGKSGIGPFALNITNLALTQYTHLTMNYGLDGVEYGFGPLDAIYGRDDQRISDWLSAMVNAHVDVAKDPYVFDLNVNQFTYNHANFLLRAGMGMGTFTFLAQPSLKQYADLMNNAGGIYGGNIDGTTPESAAFENKRKKVYKSKLKYFTKRLKGLQKLYADKLSDAEKTYLNQAIEYYEYLTMTPLERLNNGYTKDNIPGRIINRSDVFNESLAKESIMDYKNENELVDESKIFNLIKSITFQLASLEAFDEINKYAQEISKLVQCSQIDTKKFGNNIASHVNFINKYEQFKYTSNLWTINDSSFIDSVPTADEEKGPKKEEISKAALNKYFSSLYLDKKLYNAVKYTKIILSRQTFTATNTFVDLFKNIAAIINGKVEYTDVNGNQIDGYGIIYKDEIVQTFAKGIDNIIRFNSFMSDGYKIYTNAVEHGDEDMIDFTMQGDIEAVRQKMKDLLFGNEEQLSIFKRLASTIKKIRKNSNSEEYEGLTDDYGLISNDLLNYLEPQTPTSKYPIGRMLLETSQMFTNANKKRRLVSAFNQLLSHPNEQIRDLAKDLAIYAYFSTYDLNTTNSFFDLVPPKYRAQYDKALKYVIGGLNSKDDKVYRNAIQSATGVSENADISNSGVILAASADMLDILSRNYWYDDNIVPVHYLMEGNENGLLAWPNEYLEIIGLLMYDKDSGKMFPTYIASAQVKNSSMYIKIRKGSGTYIYRKVGSINRTHTDEDGKTKTGSPFDIYIAVPKAGLHRGKINQFELYCDYETPSIFEENKLPTQFAEDKVRKDVEQLVKEQQNGYYDLLITWDSETVSEARLSTNRDIYFKETVSGESQSVNGIIVYKKADGEKDGQRGADIIINVKSVHDESKENTPTPNIKKGREGKVIDLPLDGDINFVLDKIQKMCENSSTFHITTSMFDNEIEISQNQIDEFIQEELNKIPFDVENRDSVISAKKKLLESKGYVESAVRQLIVDKRMHEFIQGLVLRNIPIDRITAASSNGHTRMAKALSYINRLDKRYIQNSNIIYVNQDTVTKGKDMRRFLSSLDRSSVESVEEKTDSQLSEQISKIETNDDTIDKAATIISKFSKAEIATEIGEEDSVDDSIDDYSIVDEQSEDDKENSQNLECSSASSGKRKFGAGATGALDDIIE